MTNIEAIRRDNPLPNVVAKIVAVLPAGKEWRACCPFHADRTPSFTIFGGGLRFHCFGCGASGDVLDFVQRVYGVTLPDAARMLHANEVPKLTLPHMSAPGHEVDARQDRARYIWERTVSATGTPAETYLRARGILLPVPADIRFSFLSCDNFGALPCLVAAVREMGGEITGVQRIWLTPNGMGKANVPNPKRSLGRVKGGAIRLGEIDMSGTVAVCEGPEDGLSLLEMLGGPIWVAAGATFLPHMQFPPDVRSIVIGADNDATGQVEANKAAKIFAKRGLTVRIVRPLADFKDFNDELRGERA